jgi:hypothetical protein
MTPTRFRDSEPGLPIEQFIQALTSQLDRAQSALALKARAGLPLTFALQGLTLDLRTHVEMSGSVVRIRPAAPGETEASMLHVALTTITKPMIEENTAKLALASDEQPLREAVGDQLSDDELRRLEWAGVQTLSQFVDLQKHANPDVLERVAQVPAMRLRAALDRAAQPHVSDVTIDSGPRLPVEPPVRQLPFEELPPRRFPGVDTTPAITPQVPPAVQPQVPMVSEELPLIRVRGHNLMRDVMPKVSIGGERVNLVEAGRRELVIAPLAHQMGGTLEIETAPGVVTTVDIPATSDATTPVRLAGAS